MLAANLERRQIGEQFKLLDTASMPERPFNQTQRLGIMSSGALAGLVIGLLIVAALELRDTSVRSEEEARAFSVPVLALIPSMRSMREARAATRRSRLIDAGGAVVLLAAVAVVVVWRLQ
jgi:hypothetical protein